MLYLIIIAGAICSTAGTIAAKTSRHFRLPLPSSVALICYAGSIWFLGQAVQYLPIALTHAILSALIALMLLSIEVFVFNTRISGAALTGFALTVTGIIVMGISK